MSGLAPARLRLCALLALVTLPGCGFYFGNPSIAFTDLNAKVLPIETIDDGDVKDMKVASQSKYKPGTVGIKDKRLMFSAKRDDAAIRQQLARTFLTSNVRTYMRFAIDPEKLTGLVDGESYGFFDIEFEVPPVTGNPSLRRIEVIYNEAINGFDARATDGIDDLGVSIPFPSTNELVVSVQRTTNMLSLNAGPPTSEAPSGLSTTVLFDEIVTSDAAVYTFGWGAAGLDKKARMYVNNFEVTGPLPDIGEAETPIALGLLDAYNDIQQAQFEIDIGLVTSSMEAAQADLETAVSALEDAIEADTLGDITQSKFALKAATKALKAITKGADQGNKLIAKGKTNAKPVQNKTKSASKAVQLAVAQLAGFRSNSYGRLKKSGFLGGFF